MTARPVTLLRNARGSLQSCSTATRFYSYHYTIFVMVSSFESLSANWSNDEAPNHGTLTGVADVKDLEEKHKRRHLC